MYILNKELFDKLPDDVKQTIESEGTVVDDKEKMAEIEALVSEPMEGEDNGQKMTYGTEGEYEDEIEEDGGIKELPESKKNGIKDFDAAAERGISLIDAMHKVNPIPKKKNKDTEAMEKKKEENMVLE